MSRNEYKIDLLSRGVCGSTTDYEMDDSFFEELGGIIQRGQLHTTIRVDGNSTSLFRFTIHSEGTVFVPCDRCLSDVTIPIDTTNELTVKLGEDYSDEGEVVIIPERDGMIDTAQFIYEYVVLSLPIKIVHADGECDAAMMATLEQHLTKHDIECDEDEESSQPEE